MWEVIGTLTPGYLFLLLAIVVVTIGGVLSTLFRALGKHKPYEYDYEPPRYKEENSGL